MKVILTAAAVSRIKQHRNPDAAVPRVRIGVRKTGCSGFGYVIEYVEQAAAGDHVFDCDGVEVVMDATSLPLLDGVRVDFRKSGLSEMFHFDNPNAAALCGCGESFTVDEPSPAASH